MFGLDYALTTLALRRKQTQGPPAFSPLSLSPTLWFDPSDTSSLFQDAAMSVAVTTDGDPVGAIWDKSGHGNHATQNTASQRPVYRTDGTYHWLQFDGVNDHFNVSFDAASWAALSGNSSKSIYAALTSNVGTSYSVAAIIGSGTAGNVFALVNDGLTLFGGREARNSYVSTSPTVHVGIKDGNELSVRYNGVLDAGPVTVLGSNTINNTMKIGTNPAASGAFTNGRLYGLALMSGVLGTTDRDNLEGYLAGQCGVSL